MSNFALQGERNQFDLRTRYGVISDSVFLLSNPEGRQAKTLANNLHGGDRPYTRMIASSITEAVATEFQAYLESKSEFTLLPYLFLSCFGNFLFCFRIV